MANRIHWSMMTKMCAISPELLESVGLHSESFGTCTEFLSSPRSNGPCCLILDVGLPGHQRCWTFSNELKEGN